MQVSLDWKFLLTIVATIAGVIVPVWLWQADQTARALQLRLVSVVSLQPQGGSGLKGLKLSFDGQDLENPYVSVLELVNNGSRPLPLAEFEGPIELTARIPVRLVRAEIASVMPADLRPQIALVGSAIVVQPLLLNPKDKIVLTVLTTGAAPDFAVRARISGISRVDILDQTKDPKARLRQGFSAAIGFLLLLAYAILFLSWKFGPRYVIGHRTTFLVALSCAFGSAAILMPILQVYALSMLEISAAGIAAALIAATIAYLGQRAIRAF